MRWLSRVTTVVCAMALAAVARAGERFVVVPYSALVFDDPAPSAGEGTPIWSNQPLDVLRLPYIVLDGGGEAYIELDDPAVTGSWPESPRGIALRSDENAALSGRLFSAGGDASGFVARRFHIAAVPERPDSRDAFYAAMEAHYRRLASANLPGAAWFRHRAALAHAERDAAATEAETETGWSWSVWDTPRASFDDTFDLFTGGRAIAENLDLERALRGLVNEEASIEIASIEGVTTRAMDWKALVRDMQPELDPLAALIPADQHAVFFPSFEALTRVLDELDAAGTPLNEFAMARSEDLRTKERYQQQLCMPLSTLARSVGPALIASVAITGSDPLLPSGSDVAVLFECKQLPLLETVLKAHQLESGATPVSGTAGSLTFSGVRSDDRREHSLIATKGNTLIVSNSPAQLERIAAVLDGSAPALASADEYVWFRDRYKRNESAESALVVLTDATIRRWASPRARIGDSRRVRAAAAMAEVTAQHLTKHELGVGSLAPSSSAADASLPFSQDFVWTSTGVHSQRWGRLDFLTPVSELDLERVTASEKQAYENFRNSFQQRWRNVFDPIALRVTVDGEKLGADLTVMPLIVGSEYRDLSELTHGAQLAPSAGDPHANTLFHFAMAFGKDSELSRMLTGGGMFDALGTDPLGWIGGGIAIYADGDEYWNELANAAARQQFIEESFYRLPLALHVEVKDPLKLAAFLTALRGMIDGAAPSMTRWENKTWREQGYVRIGVDDDVDLTEAISEAALFYVPMPDALVLSLREDVVQRAIDRRLARKAGEVDPARGEPWPGSSVGLRVERAGLELFSGFASESIGDRLQTAAWSALPILNEWKRRYPGEDPVALHEELWGVRLTTPNGGTFRWNDALQTMEASDYGSPAAPVKGPLLPQSLARFERVEFGLSFEGEGLRVRAELRR